MKVMTKRLFALLTVLALCLSLLPAVEFTAQAATVDYVYSGNYIKNWGTRGTTATFLSPKAEEFYEKNNTTYDKLSALAGSSSESSIPSSVLYETLHDLMKDNHKKITSYDGTRSLFQYTDCQNSGKTDNGKISSFYSGDLIGPKWDDGGWNREHTWPNSKGDAAGSGENDIMMLRPTSTSENSGRNNDAYGQSSGYYNPNSESGGKYDLRGDVARIVLYVYVRWKCTNTGKYNPNGIFGTGGVIESQEVLLDWMEADPVDTWELGRNDSVESITGTRNVFVDYPELGFTLFNKDVPAGYTSPSGSAATSSYTITAVSGNNAFGTVSLNGKSITASPKTGYMASGYTLISGTATVVQEGNVFTVTPTSDCIVQINFAARERATFAVVENGKTAFETNAYVGDTLTLPAHSAEMPEGATFAGWVGETVSETNKRPTLIYTPGTAYTISSTKTVLYALYSYASEGESETSDVFQKVTATPASWDGEYVLTGLKSGSVHVFLADGTTPNTQAASKPISQTSITQSGNNLNGVTDDYMIVIENAGNNQYTIRLKGANATLYLAVTSNSNSALSAVSTIDNKAKWTLTAGSGGSVTIKNVEFANRQIQYNASSDMFRPYTGTQTAVYLYKAVAGSSTMYATSIGGHCDHANAQNVPEQKPTCTELGYTAGLYCPDCEIYLSGHETVGKVDHIFENGSCVHCNVSIGDLNCNGTVNEADAIYLLQHLLMPGTYKVDWEADFDSSSQVDEYDVVYLLQHVLMPGEFPLR